MDNSTEKCGDFEPVVTRKRKLKISMDTASSEHNVKRPHFPQISGDKLMVSLFNNIK